MENNWQTRNTLLERAKDPNDQQAWVDFTQFYTPFIHIVLRQINLYDKDADDTTQEILLTIWKYLKSFDREKHQVNFRTWLATVIRNAAYKSFNKKSKHQNLIIAIEESENLETHSVEESEIAKIISNEWESYLVERALENIKLLFSGVAVQAFELSLDDKSSHEIGEILQISPDSARTLKNRVKNRLIQEIQLLKESQEI